LEIDLDRTKYRSSAEDVDSTSIVKRCDSMALARFQNYASSVVPSSFQSAVANIHSSNNDYHAYVEQCDSNGNAVRGAFTGRKDGQHYRGFFGPGSGPSN